MWRQIRIIVAHEFVETSAGAVVQDRAGGEGISRKEEGIWNEGNQSFPKWETMRKEPPEKCPVGSRVYLRDGDFALPMNWNCEFASVGYLVQPEPYRLGK